MEWTAGAIGVLEPTREHVSASSYPLLARVGFTATGEHTRVELADLFKAILVRACCHSYDGNYWQKIQLGDRWIACDTL